MQHSRFLVLTGHLNDYPLSDLVGILRHQQKTGRLLIEYPNSPASFFFNEGELVDAQLDKLSGLQAVCVALAQPPSSFNFNPLIRPTRRSIENSLQKVVSELLGCWGGNELEVDMIAAGDARPRPSLLVSPSAATLPEASQMSIEKAPTFLSLPPAPRVGYSRPILAMAAAGLLLLGLSTGIAVTAGLGNRVSSSAAPVTSQQTSENGSVTKGSEGLSPISAKTEVASHSRDKRASGKGGDVALALEQPSRQESRNPSVDKQDKQTKQTGGDSTTDPDSKAPEKQTREAPAEIQSVRVVLQIEGGRVAQASIANHRTGMEAYEALALRIARQRRYPSKGPTQETVTIKLSPPN